jgi:hypothetical protein
VHALLVTESQARREHVFRSLSRAGFDVVTVKGHLAALEAIAQLQPSLLVVDLMGPSALEGELLLGLVTTLTHRCTVVTLALQHVPHSCGDYDLDPRQEIGDALAMAVGVESSQTSFGSACAMLH